MARACYLAFWALKGQMADCGEIDGIIETVGDGLISNGCTAGLSVHAVICRDTL